MSEEKSISLRYRGEGSDKVYQAQLRKKGAGWVVDFQYGAYGVARWP